MSDTEFEKFLQQSISSGASHSSLLSSSGSATGIGRDFPHRQSEELNDQELEAMGSFWLKSSGQLRQSSVQVTLPSLNVSDMDEFAKDSLDTPTSMERKTTKSRGNEDTLTDLLSQTAMENASHQPGPDTLEENADKSKFFAELEDGRATPIDYSELNKGLNESRRMSLLDSVLHVSASDDELPSQYKDDFESLSLPSSDTSKMVTPVQSKVDLSPSADGSAASSQHVPQGYKSSPLHGPNITELAESIEFLPKSTSGTRTRLDSVLDCLTPDAEMLRPSKQFLANEDSRDIPLASSNLGSLRSTAVMEEKNRTKEIVGASLSNSGNTSKDEVTSRVSLGDVSAETELGSDFGLLAECELDQKTAQTKCKASTRARQEGLDQDIDILSPPTESMNRSRSVDRRKPPTGKPLGPCHVPLSANTLELSLQMESLSLVPDQSSVAELNRDFAELQSALSAAGLPQVDHNLPDYWPISANGAQVGGKLGESSELAKPLPSQFNWDGSMHDKVGLQEVIRAIASEELTNASKDLLKGNLLSPSASCRTSHSLPKANVTAMSRRQSNCSPRPSRSIMARRSECLSNRRDLISPSSTQSGLRRKQVSTSAYHSKTKSKGNGKQRSLPFSDPTRKLVSKQTARIPTTRGLLPESQEAGRPLPSGILTQQGEAVVIECEESGHVTKYNKMVPSQSGVKLVSKHKSKPIQLPSTTTKELGTAAAKETDEAGLVSALELEFLHREEGICSHHFEEISQLNQKHSIQVEELEMALKSHKLVCRNDSVFLKEKEALQREAREQEGLILGYQKENERLYAELTSHRRDSKATNFHQQGYQRMARELADTKAQLEEQLRLQLSQEASKSPRLTQLEEMLKKEASEKQQLQQQLQHREQELASMKHQNRSLQLLMAGSISKQALQQLTKRHMDEISSLMKKNDKLEKAYKHLEHVSEILRSREAEIARLKEKMTSLESGKFKKLSSREPRNQANNTKRVQQLEKQVKDLEKVIQKRFPNSLAALIMAANSPERDALAESALRVEELEGEVKEHRRALAMAEAMSTRKYEALHEAYSKLKSEREELTSLTEQGILSLHPLASKDIHSLTAETPHTRTHPHSHPQMKTAGKVSPVQTKTPTKSDECLDVVQKDADVGSTTSGNVERRGLPQVHALVVENKHLKEELSQKHFEMAHEKVQLQGRLAEAERKATLADEELQKRVAQLKADYQKRLDSLVAKLATDNSNSEVTKLKCQLKAREATVVHLNEKMACLEYDSRQLTACKAQLEELTRQVKSLSEELVIAQRHHTPEMHHFMLLQARINMLEKRCRDSVGRHWGRDQQSTSGTSQMDIEHKWRCRVVAKNAELEEYRAELDSLLAALRVLQHGT